MADLSILSDEALQTFHQETKDALAIARTATSNARYELGIAEEKRQTSSYIGDTHGLSSAMAREDYSRRAVAYAEADEAALLRERSQIAAELCRRSARVTALATAALDARKEAARRNAVAAGMDATRSRSLMDRAKEAVFGASRAKNRLTELIPMDRT